MPERSPWDGISIPGTDFNVRLAAGDGPVPCYWGRDAEGGYLFILELAGDHSAQFRRNVTRVNGLEVDLRDGRPNNQRLVLKLEKLVDHDLFGGLCHTLLAALGSAGDPPSALAIALAHIRRWKTFLAGRGGQHLSDEEVRGLFAELVFLKELLGQTKDSSLAVSSWLGPERSHQDFIFGNTAVEIKSLSGTERSTIRISSEDQLESLNDRLYLRLYRLSVMPEAQAALSLNALVVEIQRALEVAGAVEDFDRKLAAYGYAPLPDYDEPRFVVSETLTYCVGENFPRIVRSALPGSITKVSYEIRMEFIATSLCDSQAIFRVS